MSGRERSSIDDRLCSRILCQPGIAFQHHVIGEHQIAVAFGVEKGRWHRHDDYPNYVTTNAASTSMRDGATTICVTAADRGHNVLDDKLYHCVDASAYLN